MIIARVTGRNGEVAEFSSGYYDHLVVRHIYPDGTKTEQVHTTFGSAQAAFGRMAEHVLNNQWEDIRWELGGKYDNE